MENNGIYELCRTFGVEGEIVGVSILTSGHINSTFKVDVDKEGTMISYIVQKVNDYVFKKPEEKWKLYVQNIILGILIGLCAIVSISMLIVAITDFEFIGLMLLALLVDIPIVIFAVIRLRKNLNLLKNNSFKK